MHRTTGTSRCRCRWRDSTHSLTQVSTHEVTNQSPTLPEDKVVLADPALGGDHAWGRGAGSSPDRGPECSPRRWPWPAARSREGRPEDMVAPSSIFHGGPIAR